MKSRIRIFPRAEQIRAPCFFLPLNSSAGEAVALFCSEMHLLLLPCAEQPFSLRGFMFSSSSLEQHRSRAACRRALSSVMRETKANTSLHTPRSAAAELSARTGLQEQPCTTRGCFVAPAGQQQRVTEERSCRELLRGVGLGSFRVLACPGVSSEQGACQSLPAWGTGISALCLTQPDSALPTRLFWPPATFSCSPPPARHSKSKPLGSRARRSFGWGRISSDSFYFCCAGRGCSQRPVSTGRSLGATAAVDCRRQKAPEASDLFWEACWGFLVCFYFIFEFAPELEAVNICRFP